MADFYLNKLRQQHGGATDETDTYKVGPWAGWGWAIVGAIIALILLGLVITAIMSISSMQSKFTESIGKLGSDLQPARDLTTKMKDFFASLAPGEARPRR